MPRSFFDYRNSDGQLERDGEGIEFPSLDAAYDDALKAAVDMHADSRRDGTDVTAHSFEIRDDSGRVLIVLPFAEALSRKS
jgi:hypothetical protein